MLIKRPADIPSSEITDKKVYLNRREFIRAATATGVAAAGALGIDQVLSAQKPADHGKKLVTTKSPLSTTETPNTWEHITTYNNYYEFGTDKSEPAIYARAFKAPEPWTVTIDGECAKKGPMNLEDILKGVTLEDRIYRHRCVEAWSMVIPWVGFSLGDFIKKLEPTSKAKFVEMTTLLRSAADAGTGAAGAELAVRRGAAAGRSDEPAHDSGRRAVRRSAAEPERRAASAGHALEVRLQGRQGHHEDPPGREAAGEYLAAHGAERVRLLRQREPERSIIRGGARRKSGRLPSLFQNHKTEMFNGYGEQVASMYTGLDLKKNF